LKSAFTVAPLAACFPTTLVVTNDSPGADTFQWRLFSQNGETATSNAAQPTFLINDPGTYTLTLTASLSATDQHAAPAEVSGIEIYGKPNAFFISPNESVFVPDTELGLINQSQDANFYEWNFDDGTISNDFEPEHVYMLEGKYLLTLVAGNDHGDKDIDGDGIMDGNVVCYDTATTTIIAKEGGFTRIPNAFTPDPNGPVDGSDPGNAFERNDVFLPVTKGVVEFNMQVYDRWGTLVFESNNKNEGWNGYDRNKNLLPAGVYVYKLTLRLADGQRTTQVGDVTMIR
jgi:gliding motility-associated-like protein